MSAYSLPDVQATRVRSIAINRVGVDNIVFPLTVQQKIGGTQTVEATFGMYSSLLHTVKGTNMSRYSQCLARWVNQPLSLDHFKLLLEDLQKTVEADDIYVSAGFTYFLNKSTPVTNIPFKMGYRCKFIAILKQHVYRHFIQVKVPIMSLCPCSKEMSLVDKELDIGHGAHNQRAFITVQLEQQASKIWLEDLIPLIETCGSSPVYPLLKRPDEKFVTEQSYKHPKFVEDIVREVSTKIEKLPVKWFKAKVVSQESIHPSECSAYISRVKQGSKWRNSQENFF